MNVVGALKEHSHAIWRSDEKYLLQLHNSFLVSCDSNNNNNNNNNNNLVFYFM